MSKKDLPENYRPSAKDAEHVLYYLDHNRKFMAQESALNKLFMELCKTNDCLDDVLIKCSTLNDFYSTNIFDVQTIAEHILNINNIDARLQQGDCSLVDEIAHVTINGKERNFYSFATKYCSHHQPEKFAIYDSYVEKVLMTMNKREPYTNEKSLKDYEAFISVIRSFQHHFGLTQYNLKELDKYLWQLGKWHFSPYESLYKYYKGEESSPFDHEDFRDHFWYGEMMYERNRSEDVVKHSGNEWVDMWTEEGKNWLKIANDDVKKWASKFTSEQFGVITYISILIGKWMPYDDQSWIIEY